MTSSGCRRPTPASGSARATSTAASTPRIPSNRPPPATVSVCEPRTSGRAAGTWPGRRPTRFPPASIPACSPASAIRSASQARACRYGGVKARLVQPGWVASVNVDSAVQSARKRSSRGAAAVGSAAAITGLPPRSAPAAAAPAGRRPAAR